MSLQMIEYEPCCGVSCASSGISEAVTLKDDNKGMFISEVYFQHHCQCWEFLSGTMSNPRANSAQQWPCKNRISSYALYLRSWRLIINQQYKAYMHSLPVTCLSLIHFRLCPCFFVVSLRFLAFRVHVAIADWEVMAAKTHHHHHLLQLNSISLCVKREGMSEETMTSAYINDAVCDIRHVTRT